MQDILLWTMIQLSQKRSNLMPICCSNGPLSIAIHRQLFQHVSVYVEQRGMLMRNTSQWQWMGLLLFQQRCWNMEFKRNSTEYRHAYSVECTCFVTFHKKIFVREIALHHNSYLYSGACNCKPKMLVREWLVIKNTVLKSMRNPSHKTLVFLFFIWLDSRHGQPL